MRILLPPSETKRLGGGNSSLSLEGLSSPELTPARTSVIQATKRLAGRRAEAQRVLKISDKQVHRLDENKHILTSPTMPAIERYTGVLYDALDVQTCAADARAWIDEHVSIQSALFGLVVATDEIPSYRLSASTALPGLSYKRKPTTLKRLWVDAHQGIFASAKGAVLDLRSKDYAALAPLESGVEATWVNVVTRDEAGVTRALNHFNKAAKGMLVRLIAHEQPELKSIDDFVSWASAVGLDCARESDGQLMLNADSVSVKAGQLA